MLTGENILKYEALKNIFKDMDSVLVAFSGGVDSALLVKAAADVLKARAMAVTAVSSIRPAEEAERAGRVAKSAGIKHVIIKSSELEDSRVANNTAERCYYCKKKTFSALKMMAEEEGISFVAEGSNIDDVSRHRPGARAIKELGIRSPLREAGLTKKDIRDISRELGLETWDAPPQSCFLTRFPYEYRIDGKELVKLRKAESVLSLRGFKSVRMRVYGERVRIEVSPEQVKKLTGPGLKKEIVKKISELGYKKIDIDPAGYRTGTMDDGAVWTKAK